MKKIAYLTGKTYDISGPAGNAFAIIGTMRSWLRQLRVDPEDIKEFIDAAMAAGDYNDMLKYITEGTGIEFKLSENDEY